MAETGTRKLAAILFSDMRGYSRQMDADELGTLRRLDEHNRILREQVERHAGRVVKTVGDAFMVDFTSSVDAVSCALDVQRALARYNAEHAAEPPIEIRIGVHVGDIAVRDGDLFGEAVNLAARLEPKAPPGGVCVSHAVLEQVRRRVQASAEDLGPQELKNISEPVRLYVLRPADARLETAVAPRQRPPDRRPWRWALGALLVAIGAAGTLAAVRALPGTPAHAPASGTLRVGIPVLRARLQPNFFTYSVGDYALAWVVEPLVRAGPSGEIQPHVVERWDTRDGGTTLALRLRPEVWFHDHPCLPDGRGRVATPADVARSLERAVQDGLELPAEGAADLRAGAAPGLRGVTVAPDGEVVVRLSVASPFASEALTRVPLLPIEVDACEDVHDFRQPVGTGPFRFAAPPLADTMTLVRHEGYWGRAPDGAPLPRLERVVLEAVPDTIAGMARMRRGELDVLGLSRDRWRELFVDPKAPRPDLRPEHRVDGSSVVVVRVEPWWSVAPIEVLARPGGALASLPLRRALSLALDRDELATRHDRRLGPAGRFLLPWMVGFEPTVPALGLDREEARRLLAAAGHPEGAGLPELTLGVLPGWGELAQGIREHAATVGFAVRVEELPMAALEEQLDHPTLDAIFGFSGARMVGSEPWPCVFSQPRRWRVPGWDHDPMVQWERAAEQERTRAGRARIYGAVERHLLRELPAIPVVAIDPGAANRLFLVGDRVQGLADPVTGIALDHALSLPELTLAGAP